MLFADEKKVREACVKCMADPDDARAYDDLLTGCQSIGRNFLRLYHIVPPTMERMVYHPYQGAGIINFNKSISEFCHKGKSLDGMIARERRRDLRNVRLAVIYDDSNSMTSWWRSMNMAEKTSESESPQTYAKVACLSLMEGLGREADINFWKYGSEVRGPFCMTARMYREIIACNGSGGSRLDLALKSVLDSGWDKKSGAKILIILTDGLPEIGNGIYAEDVMATVATLDSIRKLINHKTHVLYLQLTTDESRKYRKIGGYTMVEFGEEIQRLGCIFMKVGSREKIEASLFKGLSATMRRIK